MVNSFVTGIYGRGSFLLPVRPLLLWIALFGSILRVVGEDTHSEAVSQCAMPQMGEGRLGLILRRYYEEGLGGAKTWDAVSSTSIEGRLTLESGEFSYAVIRKKPEYIKTTLGEGNHAIVAGYNGKRAWQQLNHTDTVKPMEADAARHFIHNTMFGSYLLYPHAPGKQIIYIDVAPFNGHICHRLKVLLPTDFQVEYFIDVNTYLIIKAVHTDLRSGKVYTKEYAAYTREFGLPIAQRIITYDGTNWVSTFEVEAIKVNLGAMPWMFNPIQQGQNPK